MTFILYFINTSIAFIQLHLQNNNILFALARLPVFPNQKWPCHVYYTVSLGQKYSRNNYFAFRKHWHTCISAHWSMASENSAIDTRTTDHMRSHRACIHEQLGIAINHRAWSDNCNIITQRDIRPSPGQKRKSVIVLVRRPGQAQLTNFNYKSPKSTTFPSLDFSVNK